VSFTVTTTSFSQSGVVDAAVVWLNSHVMTAYASQLSSSTIFVTDIVNTVGSTYTFNIYLAGITGPNNAVLYYAMDSIASSAGSFIANVVPQMTLVTNSAVVENPAATVQASVAPFLPQELVPAATQAEAFVVTLSATPRFGTSVTLTLSTTNAAAATVVAPSLTISWPANTGTFQLAAGTTVGASGTVQMTVDAGSTTDTPSRFVADASWASNAFVVGAYDTITIGMAPGAVILDRLTSPNINILYANGTARSASQTSVNELISITADPPLLVIAPSSDIRVTSMGLNFPFTVQGPIGTYQLDFTATLSHSHVTLVTTSLTVDIVPLLEINVSTIAAAYMLDAPYAAFGGHGGAYGALTVTLSGPAVEELIISLGSKVSPYVVAQAPLHFLPGGATTQSMQLRALAPGNFTLNLTQSGADAVRYSTIAVEPLWQVLVSNPACAALGTLALCEAEPGCVYNDLLGACNSSSLPFEYDALPVMYDGESLNVTFTLPTAVQTALTISFVDAGGRAFASSAVQTLAAGETEFTLSIDFALLNADAAAVSSSFILELSGADFARYAQPTVSYVLNPKVRCSISPPLYGFFVGAKSENFTMECEQATDTWVTFYFPNSTSVQYFPSVLTLNPGETTASFYAESFDSVAGSITLEVNMSSPKMARFRSVEAVTFRILPSGVMTYPPPVTVTQYRTSEYLHVDLSVEPPQPMYVNVTAWMLVPNPAPGAGTRVCNNNSTTGGLNFTSNSTGTNSTVNNSTVECVDVPAFIAQPAPFVEFFPASVLPYNATVRGSFAFRCNTSGTFQFTFTLWGVNTANYVPPTRAVQFIVQPSRDGLAFTRRLSQGFISNRQYCRVNVGRRSVNFDGQDEIDEAATTCTAFPKALNNTTYNCSQWPTQERCQAAVSATGHACAWLYPQGCTFVKQMQGVVSQIAFGSNFTVFLDTNGTVWTIGLNRYGQLGQNSSQDNILGSVYIAEFVSSVAVGNNHVIALARSGEVYTWGANQHGQLGVNTKIMSYSLPQNIDFPSENVSCVSAGTMHSAAVTRAGRVYLWGNNDRGQLGMQQGYRSNVFKPTQIARTVFSGDTVVAVQCGEQHTMVATSSRAFTFGSSTMGQLGRTASDDYNPKEPVLWNDANTQYASSIPDYASFVLGRNC
jgi:hypothetical protein